MKKINKQGSKKVLIVMGSTSDLPDFKDALALLDGFKVGYDLRILSAHRSPKLLTDQLAKLPRSFQVIIAAAGGAAHLAGVVASHSLLPVIGVPMGSKLKGVDSFVSTSQMPAGIPVATMSIGKAGATNAVLFAAAILAQRDSNIHAQLSRYRKSLVAKIRRTNREFRKSRRP